MAWGSRERVTCEKGKRGGIELVGGGGGGRRGGNVVGSNLNFYSLGFRPSERYNSP